MPTALNSFGLSRLPEIVFGNGQIASLTSHLQRYGKRALVVTGSQSFCATPHWETLQANLRDARIQWDHIRISGEPTPELVDEAVQRHTGDGIDVVAGIGGGSALDAAKAIAGLLPSGDTVMSYLEGVGAGKTFEGPTVPLIAAPTTAGTGSEATKNAVLTRIGPDGFKKSFRHADLVARVALVDPALLASCPADLIAADGMDAFTQLLESYTSSKANPITDALAWSGLEHFCQGFWKVWHRHEEGAAEARSHLAYASLMSGICLGQVGLGIVHGLASPFGARYPIPHGVVCGTLLGSATAMNITALRERDAHNIALEKYARVGRLVSENKTLSDDDALAFLIETLNRWTETLGLPRLSRYDISQSSLSEIVDRSGMKNNPITLTPSEVTALVTNRL